MVTPPLQGYVSRGRRLKLYPWHLAEIQGLFFRKTVNHLVILTHVRFQSAVGTPHEHQLVVAPTPNVPTNISLAAGGLRLKYFKMLDSDQTRHLSTSRYLVGSPCLKGHIRWYTFLGKDLRVKTKCPYWPASRTSLQQLRTCQKKLRRPPTKGYCSWLGLDVACLLF